MLKLLKDAEVKQGDIIAKAGRNELEKEDGVHLHFEVRQGIDGPAMNPETCYGRAIGKCLAIRISRWGNFLTAFSL